MLHLVSMSVGRCGLSGYISVRWSVLSVWYWSCFSPLGYGKKKEKTRKIRCKKLNSISFLFLLHFVTWSLGTANIVFGLIGTEPVERKILVRVNSGSAGDRRSCLSVQKRNTSYDSTYYCSSWWNLVEQEELLNIRLFVSNIERNSCDEIASKRVLYFISVNEYVRTLCLLILLHHITVISATFGMTLSRQPATKDAAPGGCPPHCRGLPGRSLLLANLKVLLDGVIASHGSSVATAAVSAGQHSPVLHLLRNM